MPDPITVEQGGPAIRAVRTLAPFGQREQGLGIVAAEKFAASPSRHLHQGSLSTGDQVKEHILEQLVGETSVGAEGRHHHDRLADIERIAPRRMPRRDHGDPVEAQLRHEVFQFAQQRGPFVKLLEVHLGVHGFDLAQQARSASQSHEFSALDVEVEEIEILGPQALLGEKRVEAARTHLHLGDFPDRRIDVLMLRQRKDGAALVHRSDPQSHGAIDIGRSGMDDDDLTGVGLRLREQTRYQRRVGLNVEDLGETHAQVVIQFTRLMGADMDDAARSDPVFPKQGRNIQHRRRDGWLRLAQQGGQRRSRRRRRLATQEPDPVANGAHPLLEGESEVPG